MGVAGVMAEVAARPCSTARCFSPLLPLVPCACYYTQAARGDTALQFWEAVSALCFDAVESVWSGLPCLFSETQVSL